MSPFERAFVEVVELSVRGGVLIGLALMARLALRRAVPPRFLFAGWLLVAGVLLLPWRLPVPWHPLTETPIAREPSAVDETSEVNAVGNAVTESAYVASAAVPVIRLASLPVAPSAMTRTDTVRFDLLGQRVWMPRAWLAGLSVLWLVGAGGFLLVRVVALRRLARALDRTRQPVDARLVAAVNAEAKELGLKTIPEIVVTPLVETPALCGLWRPRLLFPVGFETRVSAVELPWVVRHELAHLQRRDTWAQAWMQAACAVHWFNPLVWLAARVAREDGELACDEAVLRRHADSPVARMAYGETLLSVIGGARSAPRLPAAVGIVEGQRQLMKRIVLIAAHRPPTLLRTLLGVALLTGVVAVGATQAMPKEAVAPLPTTAVRSEPLTDGIQWDDRLTYTLEGIGRVAGEPVAIIAVGGNLSAVTTNSSAQLFRVEMIDVEKKQVTLIDREKTLRMLALTASEPIELPQISPSQLELLLSKESIKRMSEYRGPSGDLTMVWDKVNREGQAQVLASYLRTGWVVAIHSSSQGSGASARNLLQKEISARNKVRQDAFLASLTPEQRAGFNPRQQLIRFTAPPAEREKQVAAGRAAQAAQAEVVASLTPEQRALYDEWQSWLMIPKNPT